MGIRNFGMANTNNMETQNTTFTIKRIPEIAPRRDDGKKFSMIKFL